MTKKKDNFDEASLTTAIKGYLGRQMLDPYASKRKKEKEVPWYLKKSDDLQAMVRKHLGEQRFEAEFQLLFEAKFPGLSFGDLPSDLQQDILKLAKHPGKVNSSWRRWEALPSELQSKIEEFYTKSKEKLTKKPSGRIRIPYIKTPTKVGAKKKSPMHRSTSSAKKSRSLPSREEYIADLKKQISDLEKKVKFEPTVWDNRFNLKAAKRQLDTVLKAGDNWRDVVAQGGEPIKKREPQGPAKYIEADPELQDAVLQLIPKVRQNRPSRGDVGPTSDSPLEHAIYRLQKVAGLIPTTPEEHAKLSKWAKEVVIGKHGGDLLDYAKGRKFTKPGRAYGVPAQHMKIKTGHKAAPPAIRTTKRARDPLFGSKKSLRSLHKAMEKTPFHQQSKFSPPVSAKRFSTKGSVGKILEKIYGKWATEWLYTPTGGEAGQTPSTTGFDQVVRAVNLRYPSIDLEDALHRYSAEAQKQGLEDEGLDDAPDSFITSLKGKISPEEMKALMELSTLTDPETIAAIQHEDFTKFERAMGRFLRDIYAKGVETSSHPGEKHKYSSPESVEEFEGPLVLSPAMKQELLRFLPMIKGIKGPITPDNVEEKAKELRDADYSTWKRVENSVYLALKKRDPALFSQELKMRERRRKAAEEEQARSFFQRKKETAHRKSADLDLTRRQLAGSEKSQQAQRAAEEEQLRFAKAMRALKKNKARKHLIPRDLDLSKSQKRELSRDVEPRDPETLARYLDKARHGEKERHGDDAHFEKRPPPEEYHASTEPEREIKTYKSPKEYNKKKDNLALIKQRGDLFNMNKKKASNESIDFSITELFEGFENSWEIDTPTKEEEWESAKPANKKDWMKDLTLESLLKGLTKKTISESRADEIFKIWFEKGLKNGVISDLQVGQEAAALAKDYLAGYDIDGDFERYYGPMPDEEVKKLIKLWTKPGSHWPVWAQKERPDRD